ncbi:HU family DNA-binding protein [bacterium]|nr:HU family DNA-binding protein [bacterium]MCB2179088.1 HU family DNA-binding protein [bacterium]
MEQLVELVSEKTGLNKEMSEKAVKIVLDFLKDKLPDPIAAQIDNILDGGENTAADLLGGLFGNKG